MKRNILTLVFCLSIFIGLAQEKIHESDVPQNIRKDFVERFEDVSTVEWHKPNENHIEARYNISRNQKAMVLYAVDGTFISKNEEVVPREMPGLISNHIRGDFPEHNINVAMMTEEAGGDISYYVEISRPGINQPVTKLYFDFFGNLTRTIAPQEAAIVEDDDEDIYYDDFEDAITIGDPVTRRELPPAILNHIRDSFEGHRFDSAVFDEIEDHGIVYRVQLRRLGYREYMHVYYDLWGAFIKELKD